MLAYKIDIYIYIYIYIYDSPTPPPELRMVPQGVGTLI